MDKDAHDVYLLLRAVPTESLRDSFRVLLAAPLSQVVTEASLTFLGELFAAGHASLGATMAGRAEIGVGDPEQVAASVLVLAADLLDALRWHPGRGESV